jgi:Glyoxalase-like domain
MRLGGEMYFRTLVEYLTYFAGRESRADFHRAAAPVAVGHHDQMSGEAVIGWIREVVLDCAEPWVLARFWAGLLGGTPVEWYPGWVTLEPPPHGQRLSFQASSTPPVAQTSRVHFDILVDDLTAAHDRVVSAGATLVTEHVSPRPGPAGEQVPWRVYRDPAGHPFCLVVR